MLLVTSIQGTGLHVNAKTEWKETEITSLTYDVAVSECEDEEAFLWKAQTASWQEKSQTVSINGEGDYSFTVDVGTEAGMKNLGYVEAISDSAMKIEIEKITVNDTYELTFESNPILQPGVANANGLANIWNTQVGTKICQNDNAYLALNQVDGAITLYVGEEVAEDPTTEDSSAENSSEELSTEESSTEDGVKDIQMETAQITSIKYEVTVEGSADATSFEWKAQAASWNERAKTVELN